ncbi:DASS family sodium-coupled anion symporter [Alkalihalophilus lindianensis]|uniref:Sodium-dependent dicarboxylate transporter SdcS n=1 Tax=Alkalihalophilus lindianensis TaxID=1630542 RepID=A0ABU3X9E1_9BACI|nr:DASS family sodium-coupled anion symporter [Alkalihalophilus lindianensis]MDV2684257.1 DASS family sodium-coupled anion symporter [Alkalihalophilus lindianensis]
MKTTVANVWNGLWHSHRQTKNLLNVFSYQKGSAAKAAKSSAHSASPTNNSTSPQDQEPKQSYSKSQLIGLILGPALFLLTILFFSPEGLSFEARAVLAITLWVATWWITEAIPIPATSILPIFLLPITGALDGGTVTSAYGDDIIFLFLGGFFIATAMEKWNLHKRMALAIIAFIGTSTQRILLGFMIATAFLSMWVSNTAAVMMMVPMGLAITAQVAAALKGKPEERDLPKFEKALIFGVGYAGTIGGLGTLIGTPPNIILAAQAQQLFGVEISFARWMMVGVPVVILLLFIAWMYLGRMAFKMSIKGLPGGRDLIQGERSKLGIISFEEKAVAGVFSFAAFMWITRDFIWVDFVPEIRDGMIAVFAAVLLFVIPTQRKFGSRILEWKDSRDIPWGVLLLFGGGLAIAAGFRETGLSDWMGTQLTVLDGLHLIVMIAAVALFVLFLTEITSNTATATMIIPVVASLALALNIHPFALMIPCAMAANCAFMLPVGTPPNAIIFGTGKLKIVEMVRVGFLINLIAAFLIVLAVYFMVPLFWGIDLNVVPSEFSL